MRACAGWVHGGWRTGAGRGQGGNRAGAAVLAITALSRAPWPFVASCSHAALPLSPTICPHIPPVWGGQGCPACAPLAQGRALVIGRRAVVQHPAGGARAEVDGRTSKSPTAAAPFGPSSIRQQQQAKNRRDEKVFFSDLPKCCGRITIFVKFKTQTRF